MRASYLGKLAGASLQTSIQTPADTRQGDKCDGLFLWSARAMTLAAGEIATSGGRNVNP